MILTESRTLSPQVHPGRYLDQASAGPRAVLQPAGVLPVPQEGDPHQAGQHDHGAPAPPRRSQEAEGVLANLERLCQQLQVHLNKQSRNVENNLSKILIGSRIFEFSCLLMQYATHYRILKTKNQENLDYATETQICLTMLSRTRIGLGLYWEICYDSWRWRCISYSLF